MYHCDSDIRPWTPDIAPPHGFKHRRRDLVSVCDVAELTRVQKGIDWRRVMMQAERLRSKRILFLGLSLARDLWGASLPVEVWQWVHAETVAKTVADRVRKKLFQDGEASSSVFKNCLFRFMIFESPQDKVWYCLRTMVPGSPEGALLPLPTSLSFLYYPFRPIRLAARYGLRLARRMFR